MRLTRWRRQRSISAFSRHGDQLFLQVRDNGIGLPPGFSIEATTSLGLSIVRGLVNSQLGGTIEMYNNNGTVAELVIPVDRPESNDLTRNTSPFAWFWSAAVQPARRCLASQSLRSFRRSSSVVPPQMPDSWFVARANSRQLSRASQVPHTPLAAMICSTAGPVLPTGKKRSGSVSRQAARSLQSSTSHSMLRVQVKATQLPS